MKITNIEKEIVVLEKRYWQAMVDNDIETMLSMTDDPCIVTGAQGISKLSKEDFLEMMKGPQTYKIKNYEFKDNYQVSVLNDDTAVIAYRIKESLEVAGRPIDLELAETSTWRRRNGQWVCSLHTETISGDPFGLDHKK